MALDTRSDQSPTWHKIYMQPTRWGLLYGVITIALLLGSINYAVSLGYYLAFLLTALAIVSIGHTWTNLTNLTIDSITIKPVFAGNSAQFAVRIKNNTRQHRYAIGAYIKKEKCIYEDIPKGESILFSIPIPTKKRGWLTIPRLTLFTEFPLGLLHTYTYIDHQTTLLVYAKPSNRHHLSDEMYRLESGEEINRQSQQKGDDEFSGHQAFQTGDSIKSIDWKASSRHQQLLSKQYASNLQQTVWYDWASTAKYPTETRISLLTKAIIESHLANLTFGLKLPGQSIGPNNSLNHYHQCLKALALL